MLSSRKLLSLVLTPARPYCAHDSAMQAGQILQNSRFLRSAMVCTNCIAVYLMPKDEFGMNYLQAHIMHALHLSRTRYRDKEHDRTTHLPALAQQVKTLLSAGACSSLSLIAEALGHCSICLLLQSLRPTRTTSQPD